MTRIIVCICVLACGCYQKTVDALVSNDTGLDIGTDEESTSGLWSSADTLNIEKSTSDPGVSADTGDFEPPDDEDSSIDSSDIQIIENVPSELAIGTCFGDNIDCTEKGREFVLEHAPLTTCTLDDKGEAHVEWINFVGCGQEPCNSEFFPFEVSGQGHITGLGRTSSLFEQVLDIPFRQWLARLDSNGEQIYETSLDSGELVGYQGLSLDSLGQAFLWGVAAKENSDVGIGFAMAKYSSDGGFLSMPIEVFSHNILLNVAAIGPQDELLVVLGYFPAAASIGQGDEDGKSWGFPTNFDLAKFDNDGKLIWNHAEISKNPVIVVTTGLNVDGLGNTWLLLEEYISEYLNGPKKTVVRINSDGNVVWRGNLPESWGNSGFSWYNIAAAREGGFFLYYEIDGTDGLNTSDKWVEKFDQDGSPVWSWRIPTTSSVVDEAEFVSDRSGDVFITLVDGSPGDNAVDLNSIFYRISSDGTSCTVSELPFTWCKDNGSNCGSSIEIRSDQNGKYYYNGVYGLARFSID